MKLFERFREIDEFFESDTFTQVDLDILIERLKVIYNDRSLLKSALNYVNLKKADFVLSQNNRITNEKHKSKPQKLKTEKKNQVIVNQKSTQEFEINLEQFVGSVELLSNKLKVSVKQIVNLLAQKGLILNNNDHLTLKELNEIKLFINARYRALIRQEKREELEKKQRLISKKRRVSQPGGVFDLVAENGGIGKLIYIRAGNKK